MVKYIAELPETFLKEDDLTALQGVGGISIIFRCEFPNRRTAIKELTDEYECLYLDEDFWSKKLQAVRNWSNHG